MPPASTKHTRTDNMNKQEKLSNISLDLARIQAKYIGEVRGGEPQIDDILNLAAAVGDLLEIVGELATVVAEIDSKQNIHNLHNMKF